MQVKLPTDWVVLYFSQRLQQTEPINKPIFYALFQKMGRDYLRLDTLKKNWLKACWRSDSDLYETFTYSKEGVKPIPVA